MKIKLDRFSVISTLKTKNHGTFHLMEHNELGEDLVCLVDGEYNVLKKYVVNPIGIEVIDYLELPFGYDEINKL